MGPIFGLTGFWPYVAILIFLFARGYLTRMRHNKTTFTIKYFMDGASVDDSTEFRTYAKLCRQMRETGQPLGLTLALRTTRELDYELKGVVTEFAVGDFHRYTATIARLGVMHRFVVEVFPASQHDAPAKFRFPASSRR
jgi:hypothetical protein